MPSSIATLRRDRTKAASRLDAIASSSHGRSKTEAEQREFDEMSAKVDDLDGQISAREEELERTAATSVSRTDAAEIARLTTAAGMPGLTADFLARGVSVEEAKTQIEAAKEIESLNTLARRLDASMPADFGSKMLAEGKSVAEVRAAIMDRANATSEDTVVTSQQPPHRQAGTGPKSAAENMRAQLERSGQLKKGA